MCRYRKHKKDTADLEDKYKRDDYGRRYACVSPRLYAQPLVEPSSLPLQLRHQPSCTLRGPAAGVGHVHTVRCLHRSRNGRGAASLAIDACLYASTLVLHQVAAEQKKSEALVARIIAAAVQRARSLDSMNQGMAEQLQRARGDISQVPSLYYTTAAACTL